MSNVAIEQIFMYTIIASPMALVLFGQWDALVHTPSEGLFNFFNASTVKSAFGVDAINKFNNDYFSHSFRTDIKILEKNFDSMYNIDYNLLNSKDILTEIIKIFVKKDPFLENYLDIHGNVNCKLFFDNSPKAINFFNTDHIIKIEYGDLIVKFNDE